jgi:hypothetical protein
MDEEVTLRTNNIGVALSNITNNLPKNTPTKIKKSIQPVVDINPFHNAVCNIVKGVTTTATGSIVAYTTPTDVDFYLTSANLSIQKDATCDVATATGYIEATINKANVFLGYIPQITLTASNSILVLTFPVPIKLDRNSTIFTNNTFTVGVCVRGLSIAGFTYDPKVYNTNEALA